MKIFCTLLLLLYGVIMLNAQQTTAIPSAQSMIKPKEQPKDVHLTFHCLASTKVAEYPVVIIDGKRMNFDSLSKLQPTDIESITIKKKTFRKKPEKAFIIIQTKRGIPISEQCDNSITAHE